MHLLTFCVFDDYIQTFYSQDYVVWQVMNIKGEATYPNTPQAHFEVLQECDDRLNLETHLSEVLITLIYTPKQTEQISTFWQQITQQYQNHSVSILPWELLYEYACTHQTTAPEQIDEAWIRQYILPLTMLEISHKEHQQLIEAINAQKRALADDVATAEQDIAAQLAKLQQDKYALQQELNTLQSQLAQVSQPAIEKLVSFLPAIFKNFWNTVSPDELAVIVGQLTAPDIKSPFHNLSEATINSKKRQFLALSPDDRQKIIAFCRELVRDHDLTVTLAFAPHIGALD